MRSNFARLVADAVHGCDGVAAHSAKLRANAAHVTVQLAPSRGYPWRRRAACAAATEYQAGRRLARSILQTPSASDSARPLQRTSKRSGSISSCLDEHARAAACRRRTLLRGLETPQNGTGTGTSSRGEKGFHQ
jgi:hypothetical protein